MPSINSGPGSAGAMNRAGNSGPGKSRDRLPPGLAKKDEIPGVGNPWRAVKEAMERVAEQDEHSEDYEDMDEGNEDDGEAQRMLATILLNEAMGTGQIVRPTQPPAVSPEAIMNNASAGIFQVNQLISPSGLSLVSSQLGPNLGGGTGIISQLTSGLDQLILSDQLRRQGG
ncbi:MAG: hypothetical protein AB7P76_06650 [Candidatus Melainabacteria bacterium]